MARGARGFGSWLMVAVACGVLPACQAPSGWSSTPPGCEGVRSSASNSSPLGSSDTLPIEEDGLRVLHLFITGSLPDEDGDQRAWLVYRGRCYALRAKLRGNTSRAFPKNSYTLKFPKDAPFEEPELGGGLTGRRKVVLISPFNDNSYLRSRLAFTLWNRMSPDHLQVKSYSAVLYLNGQYWGLYTVADHIDRHLLASQGLDAEGHLFKAVSQDANFSRLTEMGRRKFPLHEGFEKKEGSPEEGAEAYASISAFTAFVADASAEAFRHERASWMNPRDYEDWWIFATLAHTSDSVAKNAYHYRGPEQHGRWRFIPWDLDASFGQDWKTWRSAPTDLADFTDRNLLFARMLADPAIAEPLRERYRALLRGALRLEVVLELIDQYAREIAPAARRDEAHWGEAYRNFERWRDRTDLTTHDEEVEYLREWVRTRWRALEHQLP